MSDSSKLILQFSESCLKQKGSPLLPSIIEALTSAGFEVVSSSSMDISSVEETPILVLSAPMSRLLEEAEACELMKRKRGIWRPVEVSALQSFDKWSSRKEGDFLQGWEKEYLLYSILNNVEVSGTLRKALAARAQGKEPPSFLLHGLQGLKYVEYVGPMHSEKRLAIWSSSKFSLLTPEDDLNDYLGPNIAFYFSWMNAYTLWLILPGVLGVLEFVYRRYNGHTVDEDPFVPLFSLVAVLWAMFFLRFWRRQELSTAVRWGTLTHDSFMEGNQGGKTSDELTNIPAHEIRPSFKGEKRRNPLTGQTELIFPPFKRLPRFAFSAFVTLLLLGLAFIVMVCSLNLQGYIQDTDLWTEKVFHIPFFAKYADEGAIFDPNGWLFIVPTILHVSIILGLNTMYREVGTWLTENENHKTDESFEQSLILKRFLFEAFDCYIALFYLAFMQFDVMKLRGELVTLYATDTLRRFGLETLLPFVLQLVTGQKSQKERLRLLRKENPMHEEENKKGEDDAQVSSTALSTDKEFDLMLQAVDEMDLTEYEQFDDYMEMVIEFGYIVLFASAFPLAGFFSCILHVIEAKSDQYKLLHLYQKPIPAKATSIGIWQSILTTLAWCSILTNCMLFSLSSEQMMAFLPSMFGRAEDGDQTLTMGLGRYVVGLCFVFEHILGLVFLLLVWLIPEVPEGVRDELRAMRSQQQDGPKTSSPPLETKTKEEIKQRNEQVRGKAQNKKKRNKK